MKIDLLVLQEQMKEVRKHVGIIEESGEVKEDEKKEIDSDGGGKNEDKKEDNTLLTKSLDDKKEEIS